MLLSKRAGSISVTTVFVLFAVIFSLISLVNHYQFRTFNLDLGMYNQAIYSYAHFRQAEFTLGLDGNSVPFLATHFSLITILYSPLYYLFGTYTLLILQIAAILLGGAGIYKYAKENFNHDSLIPIIILIQFFSIWGIYSALSFDFHDNVIGAMLVPWLVYFVEKRKFIQSSVLILLILFSKEIMSFWVLFILIGLMIKNRKISGREYIKYEIPAAFFCLLYGIMVIFIIMPMMQGADHNLQFSRYSFSGDSPVDLIRNFIHKPQLLFSQFFRNTLNDPAYNRIKTEFHLMVLVSGGICLILRPAYLLMLLPIYAVKFLTNDYALWGINQQYSIEFVPIISLALIDFIKHAKKYRYPIVVILTMSTIYFNLASMVERNSKWYKPENTQFFSKCHYNSELNLHEIRNALKLIDKDAKISVSSTLGPHLAFREKIYHFPVVKDADYIVLITNKANTYPLNPDFFSMVYNEYKNSGSFITVYYANDLLILKRITNN